MISRQNSVRLGSWLSLRSDIVRFFSRFSHRRASPIVVVFGLLVVFERVFLEYVIPLYTMQHLCYGLSKKVILGVSWMNFLPDLAIPDNLIAGGRQGCDSRGNGAADYLHCQSRNHYDAEQVWTKSSKPEQKASASLISECNSPTVFSVLPSTTKQYCLFI